MTHEVTKEGTAKVADEKSREFCFNYEDRPYHSTKAQLTILEIKLLVGQEPDVAMAEIVDGRQVERPNDYVVDLSKGCAFKRVPEFVRG
jgi:hypothetical protein